MTKLIADIGNTSTKIAVFKYFTIIHRENHPHNNNNSLAEKLLNLQKKFTASAFIMSSVREDNDFFVKIADKFEFSVFLSEKTPVPIKNLYKSPETLGKDRLAAAVGANFLYPDSNLLIFDAGTALTVDLVNNNNEYEGGIISPGKTMRYKALNFFTRKLPLITEFDENLLPITGKTTETAIEAGVKFGLLFEVSGYIDYFKQLYPDLKTVFSGGDLFFFEKNLKKSIFAHPEIVLTGLNRILDYNA